VRNGYRHLDLAYVYENQDEVGRALKKVIPSVVKREELFITSKLWNNAHRPDQVEKQLDETLEQLGVDYLDLYRTSFLAIFGKHQIYLYLIIYFAVIHFPVSFAAGKTLYPRSKVNPDEVDIDMETSVVDTWKAMIALPKSKVSKLECHDDEIESIIYLFSFRSGLLVFPTLPSSTSKA
jgi:L-glyceraldehyde reductase